VSFQIFHTVDWLPVVLSMLSQNRVLFRVRGWHPYWVLKWHWTAVRDCNSATHNMHWTCSCGVDILTELAEGNQLAHAGKPGMNKKLSEVSFPMTKLDMCMIISFWDINFYSRYLSSRHPVYNNFFSHCIFFNNSPEVAFLIALICAESVKSCV
jgi:hypothetical protein